jgi:hypothetical protein
VHLWQERRVGELRGMTCNLRPAACEVQTASQLRGRASSVQRPVGSRAAARVDGLIGRRVGGGRARVHLLVCSPYSASRRLLSGQHPQSRRQDPLAALDPAMDANLSPGR